MIKRWNDPDHPHGKRRSLSFACLRIERNKLGDLASWVCEIHRPKYGAIAGNCVTGLHRQSGGGRENHRRTIDQSATTRSSTVFSGSNSPISSPPYSYTSLTQIILHNPLNLHRSDLEIQSSQPNEIHCWKLGRTAGHWDSRIQETDAGKRFDAGYSAVQVGYPDAADPADTVDAQAGTNRLIFFIPPSKFFADTSGGVAG